MIRFVDVIDIFVHIACSLLKETDVHLLPLLILNFFLLYHKLLLFWVMPFNSLEVPLINCCCCSLL